MSHKFLPLALVVASISVLGVGCQAPKPPVASEPVAATQTTYTAKEVAGHGSAQSCWSIIDGTVYDLTSFASGHPGGDQAILAICGLDGTAAFNGQHGGNPRTLQILSTLKIGTVAK